MNAKSREGLLSEGRAITTLKKARGMSFFYGSSKDIDSLLGNRALKGLLRSTY